MMSLDLMVALFLPSDQNFIRNLYYLTLYSHIALALNLYNFGFLKVNLN
jgi:hypothetical protein